jgi:6-phosphogluconolactonase
MASANSHLVFIGTYTRAASRGIYALRLDDSGALSAPSLVAEVTNPTFLALHPNGRVLYAVGEQGTVEGRPAGVAVAFTLDPTAGALREINRQPSGGLSLTHLAADGSGHALVAVSYNGGYVVSFPLRADGGIEPRKSVLKHQGPLGPNKSRQDTPHPHSVTISPDNRFALVADLALDRVFSYRLDAAAGSLAPNDPPFITITPGTGPRHSKFSNDGRFFYVLNEIDGSVTACSYDAAHGVGVPLQHISTLPAGFQVKDPDRAAEIRIHPNGKFLYASNRGHDSIAVFAIDPASGKLALVEITACGGKAPRNFALSPEGKWLLCANQDSDSLTVFSVDGKSGRLSRVGGTGSVPVPVCVLFHD